MGEGSSDKVVVEPEALVGMALHALAHPTKVVHGILVGTIQEGAIHVFQCFPVCHEIPTKPLVESSIALTLSTLEEQNENETKTIVGWYTAPEKIAPSHSSAPLPSSNAAAAAAAANTPHDPVALRIAANLSESSFTKNKKSILIKVRNEDLAQIVVVDNSNKDNDKSEIVWLDAFGKDFGQQWKEPLPVSLTNAKASVQAIQELAVQKPNICDLVDHWNHHPSSSDEWTGSATSTTFLKLKKGIEKYL